jgi:hyperosmotically inducible periplasmic protein
MIKFKSVLPTALLGIAIAVPVMAQEVAVPASDSMHQAGEKMEQAGSDTAAAATDAFKGTRRAVDDSKITIKVKTALHEDKHLGESDIHVNTTAGVVTLTGIVSSPDAAAHAVQIAQGVEGVNSVNSQLAFANASAH